MIGNIVGNRYELIEILGEGGMAIVYKAKDKKLNRFVAVKVLKKEFAYNKEISDKFNKEATAVANLSDMNIVNVLDVGHEDEDNIDYFVMELVDGKTLKDIIIYNGKLSWNTAISIGIQVAKALNCAHRNNIIHRDIKPQNILVTHHKDIKVTDFGIAKSATSATITNTTTIMGSAHYLSPEQAKGGYIDFKSDLYSLGVVLYEMVTGVLPFQGESPVTVALKHIQDDPINPKEINESIPESLGNLILKLMSKDPKDRYQSAEDTIADLQRVKDNPDVKIMNVYMNDDNKTIVMAPIKGTIEDDKTADKGINSENEYDEDDEKENNNSKMVKIGIIVAAIIIAILFIIFRMFTSDNTSNITVPNLISEDITNAQNTLIELGLEVKIIQEVSDENAGAVLEMNPKYGEVVEEGSLIELTISSGIEMIRVPDLRDFEEKYIIQILNQEEVNYEIIEKFDDYIEEGYFIKQEPEADSEMPKNGTIYVTISKGPEVKFVEIRDYKGLSIDDVQNELKDLGIEVRVNDVETDDESKDGIIESQSLEIGKKVEEGYPITFGVYKYVEPTIEVREHMEVGMLLVDALANLDLAGLKYHVEGGTPLDTSKYKIVSFTQQIKISETVRITAERIPYEEPEEEKEPENEENSNNSNQNSQNENLENNATESGNVENENLENNATGTGNIQDESLDNNTTENGNVEDENLDDSATESGNIQDGVIESNPTEGDNVQDENLGDDSTENESLDSETSGEITENENSTSDSSENSNIQNGVVEDNVTENENLESDNSSNNNVGNEVSEENLGDNNSEDINVGNSRIN